MHIIIYGFHLFPQFHRAGLSDRVISKNRQLSPSLLLLLLLHVALLDVAKKKEQKKKREGKNHERRTTMFVARRKRERFSIRFLQLAIISSPSSPLLIIRRDTAVDGSAKVLSSRGCPGHRCFEASSRSTLSPSPLCY